MLCACADVIRLFIKPGTCAYTTVLTTLTIPPAPLHVVNSGTPIQKFNTFNMASPATNNIFYVGPWTFEVTLDEEKLRLLAHSNSGDHFSLTISGEKQLAQITAPGFHFPSFEALRKCVELALQKKEALSARVEKSCKDSTRNLVLAQQTPYAGEITLSLELTEVPQTVENRLEYIYSFISTWTKDRLSSLENCKHANLTVFHNGLAVVKHTGGNGHVSVSTSEPFTYGKHYFEVKIVRCVNNACMVGVQSALQPLTPYAGANPFATGKSIYGNNGHCYRDNTNADYGLGGFGPGDYVGLLLDMDAKKVTFYINGRSGAPMDLVDHTYYFVINVHSVGDTVKLLPKYCRHA